jgi:hypothetical protein
MEARGAMEIVAALVTGKAKSVFRVSRRAELVTFDLNCFYIG